MNKTKMNNNRIIQINLPEYVQGLIRLLADSGFKAFAVGGCVRDSIMGIEPNDWDICTNAMPDDVIKALCGVAKVFPTGIKHGTVTVILNEFRKAPMEVTTFRAEGDYEDCRHPKSVEFVSDIKADLMRRDFTINAMAYNDEVGLVDLFGGESDLNDGIIRCVGNADRRFSEDALRIMRAMRFGAVLGFDIEEKTYAAMYEKRELLKNISSERIFSELKKLVLGKSAAEMLKINQKILAVILSECFLGENKSFVNLDMLKYLPCDIKGVGLRLAAVLLPSGKAASGLMHRLKSDNATRSVVKLLTGLFGGENIPKAPKTRKDGLELLREYGFEDSVSILTFARAYALANNDDSHSWDNAIESVRNLEENGECYSISRLAINGRDLLKLGIEGRRIGECLEALLDAVVSGMIPNKKKEAEDFVKNYFKAK